MALTARDGNGQTQQLQARRRDNQGSEPPAEGLEPLRTQARAGPAELKIKSEREQAWAEAGRRDERGYLPQ